MCCIVRLDRSDPRLKWWLRGKQRASACLVARMDARHGLPGVRRGFLKRGVSLSKSLHQRRTALLDRFVSTPAPNPVEKHTPGSTDSAPGRSIASGRLASTGLFSGHASGSGQHRPLAGATSIGAVQVVLVLNRDCEWSGLPLVALRFRERFNHGVLGD
jgi:hypothetical protein